MSEFDPLQSLWTKQQQEPFVMSLTDIHARAQRFQTRIRWRNWIEYGAGALVIFAFTNVALATPDWGIRASVVLIILGICYISWKLATVAGAARKDDAVSWADFHRAELVRQHRALSTVWSWYLAPLAPGALVFILATAFSPAEGDIPLFARVLIAIVASAWVAAVFCGVAYLNKKGAQKLQADIDALDRARE
jgi:hypothetical protein